MIRVGNFDLPERIGEFGIEFLDDKLSGIYDNNFILVGAGSGVGKSTLANQIAFHNAIKGVKTALFSIENDEGDSVRSQAYCKWKLDTRNWAITMNEWFCLMKDDPETFLKYMQEANKDTGTNLLLFERDKTGYDLQRFEDDFMFAKQQGCQLIVFDHIDYFSDMEGDKYQDTFVKTRKIMEKMRSLQDGFNTPIIAFSQFRKRTDKDMQIPTIDEFYGSSEKAKIATTVITVSADEKSRKLEAGTDMASTYIAIRKNRYGDQFAARCVFDKRKRTYVKQYQEVTVDFWGKEIENIDKGK